LTIEGVSTTLDALLVSPPKRVPSSEENPERQLVERAAGGDRAAFGQLYQHYIDDVYAYVQLRVRDVALAEDLTQDVFVSVFKALPRFRWQGSFAPWLLRCAHNRVVNHWRSQGRRPELVSLPMEGDEEASGPELAGDLEPLELVDIRLSTEEVTRAMAQLTDLQQQVIAFRFGAGLTLAETAQAMERSENAVKNLQHNALAALRRQLLPEQVPL
jgi:RNA polymerase sigma-70 factor (ECF subfamily)